MNTAARQSQSLDRIANDFYPTDHGFTRVMLETLPVALSGPILEPCAGERDIVQILRQSGLEVEDTDITDGPELDAATDEYWADRAPDWTITNPPFNLATKILQKAYDNSRRGVLIFLRITYLEPCPDRANWLDEHADQLRWMQVVNPRPIFRADTNKTDSATCVWLLWDKQWSWLSLGVEPPFRFIGGSRCPIDKRRTAFPPSAPKLQTAHRSIFDRQFSESIESQDATLADGSDAFDRKISESIEKLEAAIVDIGAAIDILRDQGVAAPGEMLAQEEKGGKVYHRVIRRGGSSAIGAGQVEGQRARLKRRSQSRRLSTLGDRLAGLKAALGELRS